MPLHRIRRTCWTLAALMTASALPLAAQREIPKVIRDGLEAFPTQGVEGAVRVLTPGWTSEDDRRKQDYVIQTLTGIAEATGRPTGSDIAYVHKVSEHVRKFYVVLLFEKMPVYLNLTAFQPIGGDWRVVNLSFNTNMKEAFPAWMADPERPE